MQENKYLLEINKRLGVVIALLLRMLPKDGHELSFREQIQLLSELGVRPKEIAEILGRTRGYINKELTTLRKYEKNKEES